MAQPGKVLATKHHELTSISLTLGNMVEEKNWLPHIHVLCPPHICTRPHLVTCKHLDKEIKLLEIRTRGRWISEFEASLVYKVSSRTVRAIQRKPVLKTNKQTNKQTKNKRKRKEKRKIHTYLSPCTKLKSKWIKDLNIKPNTPNLIEEKVGKNLELIGIGGNFLNRTPLAQAQRSRIDKWNLMKLESFCKAKDTVNKTYRPPTDWEKNLH